MSQALVRGGGMVGDETWREGGRSKGEERRGEEVEGGGGERERERMNHS